MISTPAEYALVKRPAKKNENPFLPFCLNLLTCLNDISILVLSSASCNKPFEHVIFSSETILPIVKTSSSPSFMVICSIAIWSPERALSTWHEMDESPAFKDVREHDKVTPDG